MLRFLCWADDARLFAATPAESNVMLEDTTNGEALARATRPALG